MPQMLRPLLFVVTSGVIQLHFCFKKTNAGNDSVVVHFVVLHADRMRLVLDAIRHRIGIKSHNKLLLRFKQLFVPVRADLQSINESLHAHSLDTLSLSACNSAQNAHYLPPAEAKGFNTERCRCCSARKWLQCASTGCRICDSLWLSLSLMQLAAASVRALQCADAAVADAIALIRDSNEDMSNFWHIVSDDDEPLFKSKVDQAVQVIRNLYFLAQNICLLLACCWTLLFFKCFINFNHPNLFLLLLQNTSINCCSNGLITTSELLL